jgi:drug/metabolite transporter (DMT)-like permease
MTESRDKPLRATVFILVSAISFTLMGVAVRYAGNLPLPEKVFFRNLVTLVISGAIIQRNGHGFVSLLKSPCRARLLWRSVFGLTGVFLYFFAIDRLTLADATMLNKLSPFAVFVMAAIFLGESMSKRIGVALLVAFAGSLLIIKPSFDLSVLPALAGAGSAFFAAAAYTLVRSLRGREPAHRIIFTFSLVSVLVTLPLMLRDFVIPDTTQWAALLGIGLAAAGGQFFLTWAYQSAPAARVSVLNYSSIVFALVAGWVLWGEMPDRWSLLGGAMIIAMALLLNLPALRSRGA